MFTTRVITFCSAIVFAGAAWSVSSCRIDGKIIYTRECMLKQQQPVPESLHQRQLEAISPANVESQKTTPALEPKSLQSTPIQKTTRAAITPQEEPKQNDITSIKTPALRASDPCDSDYLKEAISQGNVERLRQCTKNSSSAKYADERGRSLIHAAVLSGNLRALPILLKHGIDLEAKSRTDKGATALHLAADTNQPAMIRELLKHGANIEARDYLKQTAVHRASRNRATNALRALIAMGADINAIDRAQQTPLITASQQLNNRTVIRQLIDANADSSKHNYRQMSAVHYAALTDSENLAQLIESKSELNLRDEKGQTALLMLVSKSIEQYWPRIEMLVKAGADLNRKDQKKMTLLKYAYARKHEPLLTLLLKHGVDSRNIARVIEQYGDPGNI